MVLPDFTTPETDALCRDIAKRSHGVAFIGISRGKDSLCAWLNLRRYFSRIIPFHCASIPNMKFVTKTLDYYEYEFQTHILRLMGEDLPMALSRHIYQDDILECDYIDENLDCDDYSKLDILDYLRYKYNLPKAWCAFGISANDSIDRLIYCRKTGGKSEDHRTFYPCWNWPKAELLRAIRESGLKLSSEYKYVKRSMGGVPSATYNKVLMEHYPEDWKTLLKWYPLAEVKNYREAMLDREAARRKEKEIVDAGGRTVENHDKIISESDSILPQSEEPAEEILPSFMEGES